MSTCSVAGSRVTASSGMLYRSNGHDDGSCTRAASAVELPYSTIPFAPASAAFAALTAAGHPVAVNSATKPVRLPSGATVHPSAMSTAKGMRDACSSALTLPNAARVVSSMSLPSLPSTPAGRIRKRSSAGAAAEFVLPTAMTEGALAIELGRNKPHSPSLPTAATTTIPICVSRSAVSDIPPPHVPGIPRDRLMIWLGDYGWGVGG